MGRIVIIFLKHIQAIGVSFGRTLSACVIMRQKCGLFDKINRVSEIKSDNNTLC